MFIDWKKDRSLAPYFDTCVQAVLDGTARITKTRAEPGYWQEPCFIAQGREVLVGCVLDYYLFRLGTKKFDYKKAHDFSERMRLLAGFLNRIEGPLRDWVERCLRNPWFYNAAKDSAHKNRVLKPEHWVLKPDKAHNAIPRDILKFACYVALCHMKYGLSFQSITANEIFGFVTVLGSDLPAKLKKNGSGTLPKEITEFRDTALSCKANDAFATVRIAIKEEAEEHYARALDFLCVLLRADFPRSYSIDFRGSAKKVLPIPGLPKCGVHSLFAGAAAYPSLHDTMERYARLVMREDEWYTSLWGEKCAMPGTFAVFALALADVEKYHALVCDYLKICDGEHQSLQGNFVSAYIEKYGFTERGLELYRLCSANIQHMPKKLTALHKKLEGCTIEDKRKRFFYLK